MGVLHPDAKVPSDARVAVDAEVTADAQFLSDSGSQSDAQVSPDLAPPFACAALQPLADGVLTERHAVRALFTPDRSSLVLMVTNEGPYGNSAYDLLLVRLPSGQVSYIAMSVFSAEWLQPGSTLLVRTVQTGSSDLVAVSTDSIRWGTLVQRECQHVVAPDGRRVYAIHDCDSHNNGSLDVIDVASGTSTRLAVGATFATPTPARSAAVSPDGRWVTFSISTPSDGGSGQSLLVVASADGQVETLTSQPGGRDPAFVSDDLLLFKAGDLLRIGDIRGHVPGTGDTSYLVAADRDPGLFGFQVSPDRTRVVGATEVTGHADELYAIRVDGSGERLLASNLYDYLMDPLARRVFAFSANGHVIYTYDDTGHSFGVASVALDGSAPTVWSTGASFLQTPRLDQVVVVEPEFAKFGTSRLRRVDLASGTEVFGYDSNGAIGAVGFPPNDNGLVIIEYRSQSPDQLRFVSANHSVVLGEWLTSQLLPIPYSSYYGTLPYIYPIDPTGCFTVFDTDLAPGPGTRLAILPQ